MSTVKREQLSQFSLFAGLADAAADEIANHAKRRPVAAGHAVFEQGAEAREFFVLLEGRLKVTQVTEDGQQIIIRIVVPGDLFGIARALQRDDYPGTATAALDSVVAVWPMNYWERFVRIDSRIAVTAMETVGKRLQESHARLRELATEEVERRIAHAVLRLVEQSGKQEPGGIRIDFPLSKQDLAEMSGTTLHTVSRIMSGWQERGVVATGRRRLLVCDRDRLMMLAEQSGGR